MNTNDRQIVSIERVYSQNTFYMKSAVFNKSATGRPSKMVRISCQCTEGQVNIYILVLQSADANHFSGTDGISSNGNKCFISRLKETSCLISSIVYKSAATLKKNTQKDWMRILYINIFGGIIEISQIELDFIAIQSVCLQIIISSSSQADQ